MTHERPASSKVPTSRVLPSDDEMIHAISLCESVLLNSLTLCTRGHVLPERFLITFFFFKSQLHQNGGTLGDFYGIWNVNTHKKWGLDLRWPRGHTNIVTFVLFCRKWPTIGNEWGNWQKHNNSAHFCVYNLQICHNKKKSHRVKL